MSDIRLNNLNFGRGKLSNRALYDDRNIMLYGIQNDTQLSVYTGSKVKADIIYSMRNCSKHKHGFPNTKKVEPWNDLELE